jgi:Zn-dependent metalloprotease
MLQRVAERQTGEDGAPARRTLAQMEELALSRLRGTGDSPAAVRASSRRNVYDAGHRQQLPGQLVMSEHRRRVTDIEVNEAYDGAGAMLAFLSDVFDRNSIDDRGMRIDSTVHYGEQFDNAFWNGRQIIFGDGDGIYFNRFTAALEVIGHELAHGITQYASGLGYSGQSGALNEHLSDAFGVMLKQYTLGQTAAQADWLIGAGLFTDRVQGRALRSLAAPGTAYDDPVLGRDPQPAHMRDYQHTSDDNGGVHVNSGIPNHAFYLAATQIGGDTWVLLGQAWYRAAKTHVRHKTTFAQFAAATVLAAGELYGVGGRVQRAVTDAWAEVGLPVLLKRGSPAGVVVPVDALSAGRPPAKWRDRPIN